MQGILKKGIAMRALVASLVLSASALTLAACSESANDMTTAETEGSPEMTAPAAPEGAAVETAVLDASTVTAEELTGLPGMTPELAQAIVGGQPYASATAFNAVLMQSLSADQAEAVRERVFVPIDLNSASGEDIALIPGMTDRMIHEFEEYRPYDDMAEFDREIGKYVDEAEVARLRQYVTL